MLRVYSHIAVIFGLIALCLLSFSTVSAQSNTHSHLIVPLEGSAPLQPAANELRANTVVVNRPLLDAELGATFALTLFDDVAIHVTRDQVEQIENGYIWTGHETIDPLTTVVLVYENGQLFGHVVGINGRYTITPQTNATYTVAEIDEASLNADDGNGTVYAVIDPMPAAPVSAFADDGSVIDLLVLYSDDAFDSTLLSEINLAVAYTNAAYRNSDIDQRINLVHTEMVTYTETGNLNSDLSHVTDFDGNIDQAHTLRDTYHADAVLLLVEDDGRGANSCGGLGWVQENVNSGFQSYAFSVMGSCLTYGISIFTHELGHNMGARHDWYVDSGNTSLPYSYAHGHIDPSYNFRTVMAYNNECPSGNCPEIAYFSNPNLSYGGAAVGVAGGTSTSCSTGAVPSTRCDADNQRTLNNTAATMAAFRTSEIVWTGAVSSDWATAGNWNMPQGTSGTISNHVPRAIDDVRIPAGTTNAPTISSGAISARNVLIEPTATLTMNGGGLTISGDVLVQNNGRFLGNGGTVVIASSLDQAVTLSADSHLPTTIFGNGSTQTITFDSDIDINGDVTYKANVTVAAGTNTVNVSGDWDDQGNGFVAETSTLILDGTAAQTVSKVTSSTVLSEGFDYLPTGCCYDSKPTGWAVEKDGGFGYGFGTFDNEKVAARWADTNDGWLLTSGVTLSADTSYTLSFDFRELYGGSNGISTFSAYVGTDQSASGMLNGTLLGTESTVSSANFATASYTFTPSANGVYYLGLRNQLVSGGYSYALFDNISLTASQNATFHNLTVANSDVATFSVDAVIKNDLNVDSDGTVNWGSRVPSVEGSVVNNGTMTQVLTVTNTVLTEFLHIENGAKTADKYWGAEITSSTGDMGLTTVSISGHQWCDEGENSVLRCTNITPTTQQTADVRLYYQADEIHNVAPTHVWHFDGSVWQQMAVKDSGGSGIKSWITADNVPNFSPFTTSSFAPSSPTAITLQSSQTNIFQPSMLLLLALIATMLLFVTGWGIGLISVKKGE